METSPVPLPPLNSNGNNSLPSDNTNSQEETAVETEATAVQKFKHQVDNLNSKVDELELKVNEVTQFFDGKQDKEYREKLLLSGGMYRRDAVCSKRMQDVMRQFGTVMRVIAQHKWAWPFINPVDVQGLGLHDYYEVIKKPMDFTTIKNQMEAGGYRNVREIYADVRLVFTNAMTYNEDKSDVHVMAKTLLEKVEEKWLQLLPKVIEAETRQKDEEAQSLATLQIAQETAIARVAIDANNELDEVNLQLEKLRELVVQRCRKMSTEEKRKLGVGLSTLSPEDLNKALQIIAEDNPNFQATAEVVDLDMDAQSETTLWRLKFFVKEALELQAKKSATEADDISKRKRVIYDALAKTAKRRNKSFRK